jgi:hypothetical protein
METKEEENKKGLKIGSIRMQVGKKEIKLV